MNLPRFALANPWFIAALTLLVLLIGGREFVTRKSELFPDTVPPQTAVVTLLPGASALDVKRQVTVLLEKELATVSDLKNLRSTSRDGVSSLQLEFFYGKPLAEAVLEVQNAISRIRAELPADILEPRVYPISDATPPVLTLALSPEADSPYDLSDLRLLAENDLRVELQSLPGVVEVQVFGGQEKEIRVELLPDRLRAYGIAPQEVAEALRAANLSLPAGILLGQDRELQVTASGEFRDPADVADAVVRRQGEGFLRVRDLARVETRVKDARSFYRGNGRPAVAVNILRSHGGNTLAVIAAVKAKLEDLRRTWPGIRFEISNDQQPVIDRNAAGMKSSLVSSVLFTMLIIVLFLGDLRASLLVLVSIPASFLFALLTLKLTDYSLNMVTLSGLIIATGMVVDATVVVLENIDRHRRLSPDAPWRETVAAAAEEIDLSIFSGMLTTVLALIPVMYVGGYPQTVLRPLTYVLASALVGSYLAAVTVIPLLAWLLLRPRSGQSRLARLLTPLQRLIDAAAATYTFLLERALHRRLTVLVAAFVLLVLTVRLIPPRIGQELMPPMDTGIVMLKLDFPADTPQNRVEEETARLEEELFRACSHVRMISTVAGSEPGRLSFGGGGQTLQQVTLTVTLSTRDQRRETVWQLMDGWRRTLEANRVLRSFELAEYGATPISTIQAPIVLTLSGPDIFTLDRLGREIGHGLRGFPGIRDLRRSWYMDRSRLTLRIDPFLARVHGLTPAAVAQQARLAVGGLPAGSLRLEEYLDLPIRIYLDGLDERQRLEELDIFTPGGILPLRGLATFQDEHEAATIVRENQRPILELTGVNRQRTIRQLAGELEKFVREQELPAGYSLQLNGTSRDMMDTMKRLLSALVFSAVLVYLTLVWSFNSFRLPFPVLIAIPLALSGSFAGLLLVDKPLCMPAMMGIILLAGTVINNSIFLVDFTESVRAGGMNLRDALIDSVRLRFRPILMTTVSTIVGMLPLILEWAVGLERMSPLGSVAAFGLAVGTMMTLIVSPVFYSLLDDWFAGGASRSPEK